jgi:hypothetical protein
VLTFLRKGSFHHKDTKHSKTERIKSRHPHPIHAYAFQDFPAST